MSKNKKQRKGIIYSTDPSFNFEYENKECKNIKPEEQLLKVFIDKQRSGRTTIIIKDFIGSKDELKSLAQYLKRRCSVGGSIKGKDVIIQGNIREKIIDLLIDKGYKYKRIGS
tara:strand:- start:90 stop:428 length:339 start_codon:yes stop_codon:yes gene_type:complete